MIVRMNRRQVFLRGMKDGVPIALGYFAVAFTLGIHARNAGLSVFEATLSSLLTNASAGEYAAFSLIRQAAGVMEVIIMTVVINARYLLMSCALSQKLSPDAPLWQRMLLGHCVTDEIFGISAAYPGNLDPVYSYGAFSVASPGWALGTALGVMLGNVLPGNAVSALSVGLYGMFIAVIIPPTRTNKVLTGVVILSMALSCLMAAAPLFDFISEGMRTILLTVLIAGGAAALFPVKDEQKEAAA